jgi:hypothetical protein
MCRRCVSLHLSSLINRGLPAQDYPEHRLQFFALLRAITNHCFSTLFAMSPAQLRMVIDSIIWAFRHTERNVADTGLNLLLELLEMFSSSDVATQFYQTYYLQLMQEVFAVMTGECRQLTVLLCLLGEELLMPAHLLVLCTRTSHIE